jgi:hypothetical protein
MSSITSCDNGDRESGRGRERQRETDRGRGVGTLGRQRGREAERQTEPGCRWRSARRRTRKYIRVKRARMKRQLHVQARVSQTSRAQQYFILAASNKWSAKVEGDAAAVAGDSRSSDGLPCLPPRAETKVTDALKNWGKG